MVDYILLRLERSKRIFKDTAGTINADQVELAATLDLAHRYIDGVKPNRLISWWRGSHHKMEDHVRFSLHDIAPDFYDPSWSGRKVTEELTKRLKGHG